MGSKVPNLGKYTVYLDQPALDPLKKALEEAGRDRQTHARQWMLLGFHAARAGLRVDEQGLLLAPAPFSPFVSPVQAVSTTPLRNTGPAIENAATGGESPPSDPSLFTRLSNL